MGFSAPMHENVGINRSTRPFWQHGTVYVGRFWRPPQRVLPSEHRRRTRARTWPEVGNDARRRHEKPTVGVLVLVEGKAEGRMQSMLLLKGILDDEG